MSMGDFRAGYSFRSGFFDYGRYRHTACHGVGNLFVYCAVSSDLFLDWQTLASAGHSRN
jgi:hypothetical protein